MMKSRHIIALFFLKASVYYVTGQGGDNHDHDHDHADGGGHDCACEAIEFGFDIDCGNRDAMLAALPLLDENDCRVDCDSTICARNFLVVQSHHDYCYHSEIPELLSDAFHIYEDRCSSEHRCAIQPKRDPDLPGCPRVDCSTNGGNNAYTAMVRDGCLDDCSTPGCVDNFHVLKSFHDTCPEGSIRQVAELAFHDYGRYNTCDEFSCNIPTAIDASSELVCSGDTGETSSSSVKVIATSTIATGLLLAKWLADVVA